VELPLATIGFMTARGYEEQVPDPRRLIALLADPARLRVHAALVLDPAEGGAQPSRLAEASGVPVRDVLRILARLEEVRLAVRLTPEEGGGWRATPETLRASVEAEARRRDGELPGARALDPATVAALRGFFSHGRLTHVPIAHAKRMIVLDYLAQSFEPGVRYPEPEVNEILQKFHDDYAALRRYLVDADFLGRSENFYWRTGGSVAL
jgi:hypothetical protein